MLLHRPDASVFLRRRNIAPDHVVMCGSADRCGMNLIFVCPRTDLNVQHRIERVSADENEYEALTCPACSRLHFTCLRLSSRCTAAQSGSTTRRCPCRLPWPVLA